MHSHQTGWSVRGKCLFFSICLIRQRKSERFITTKIDVTEGDDIARRRKCNGKMYAMRSFHSFMDVTLKTIGKNGVHG